MSDFDLDFGVRVNNVDQALRDIGRINEANRTTANAVQSMSTTTTRQLQQLGTATQTVGVSMQQMGQRAGQTLGALGQFTSSLGQLPGISSTAGSAISQLGGAVGALSGAMGPFGVALGVATLAINAYRLATSEAGTESQSAEASTRGHREEIERLADSAQTASQQLANLRSALSEREASATLGRMARGEFQTADEARLQAERLRRLDEEGRRQGGTAAEIFGGAADEAARIEQQASAGTFDPPARRGGGGGGSSRDAVLEENLRGYYERSEAIDRMLAQQRRQEEETGRFLDARREAEFSAQKAHDESMLTLAQRTAEEQKRIAERATDDLRREQQQRMRDEQQRLSQAREAEQAFVEASRHSVESTIEAWTKANVSLERAGADMLSSTDLMQRGMVAAGNEISNTIGGTMKSAFEEALGAWLDGSKSFVEAAEEMARGVLKALVIESIVQAVVEGARAIASAASYDFSGAALHAAAAAAWAGVGLAAGGVAAAIGGVGGGAGQRDMAASTVTPTDASTSAQQSQPINITVYPGGFITRRDVSMGILDALNEAGLEGGILNPQLLGGRA